VGLINNSSFSSSSYILFASSLKSLSSLLHLISLILSSELSAI
jgi:hypothetical protein